ncbi:MAG: peptidyl-prolyl cis-trans isomerase [Candidatus Andeanibacterium colombiense]|uniref:Parvulin-like PPIase n=1 Tax=Candidatus Andeanibacterium colombiense TaxID=3121345 RepID=A0AAJ6BMA8_9SPHN|nr:MAG: peptidyl-prolyl cis-trans isomerase [Sphingomonadaceae bacterium]
MYKQDAFAGGEVPAVPGTVPQRSRLRNFLARPRVRAILREPLTHFLLFGILIFLVAHGIEARSKRYTIDVGPADVTRIVNSFEQQYGSEPDPVQIRTMIDNYIREEIYLREGLALGLDKNDEIVRRRVAQKYDFLQQDMAVPREPAEAQLRGFYASHRADFKLPERRSFDQVYFSIDQRGEDAARSLAEIALAKLDRGEKAAGDEFPGPPVVSNLSQEEANRLFGGDSFAPHVFKAPQGRWTGPLRSGFGWHLVRVSQIEPSRARSFDEARGDVRLAWIEADRQARNRVAYDELRRRYTINGADRP